MALIFTLAAGATLVLAWQFTGRREPKSHIFGNQIGDKELCRRAAINYNRFPIDNEICALHQIE